MELPANCVVDASVVVRAVVSSSDDAGARSLLEVLTDNKARLYAPDLIYIECANAFWKYVRLRGMSPKHAQEALDFISEIELNVFSLRTMLHPILQIALETEISAYDASYVLLAREFGATLITADQKLVDKLRKAKVRAAHYTAFDTK